MENVTIFTKADVLALPVTQDEYDRVSLNRTSSFVNEYTLDDETNEWAFSHAPNSFDLKKGRVILALTEILRAAENMGLAPANSLVIVDSVGYRKAAIPTADLQTALVLNLPKKEDFKKQAAPAAPTSQAQTSIQNTPKF